MSAHKKNVSFYATLYWQEMSSFKLRSQIKLIMRSISNQTYDFGWEFKQILIFDLYKDW